MSFLPGWDSLETTETIAHNLHIAAVIVLGLLFLAEGMALVYDFRNHGLSRAAAVDADNKRQRDADAAESRRKAEVEGLQKQLSEADTRLAAVQKQQAPRRLTEAQKQFLIAQLSPYRGEKIEIVALLGDQESMQFAQDFHSVFVAAGWQDLSGGVSQAVITGGAVGIEITLNQAEAQAGRLPPVLQPLINALTIAGLMPHAADGRPNVFMNPQSPTDHIVFRVGSKPSP